jgi:hypothetical protein
MRPLKNIHFCSSSRKAKILTTGIHGVFRGLKFKSDAEIGLKGRFFKGLTIYHLYIGINMHHDHLPPQRAAGKSSLQNIMQGGVEAFNYPNTWFLCVNMGVMMGPMLLQPAVGWILDRKWQGEVINGLFLDKKSLLSIDCFDNLKITY